jgi:predicted transcriptional regulator
MLMIKKITIADYMVKNMMTVKQNDDVLVAIKQLLSHKTTCAPVLDSSGVLVGMLSEKDCMRVVLDYSYNQGMSGKVDDFMRKEIISVNIESSIVDLAEKFKDSSVRSFPVFDDKKFVGVISRTDVLRALVAIK